MLPFSKETADFLCDFSKKYPLGYVLKEIDNLQNLKVLVAGEAILDNYHFGSTIGKAAKEPIVVLKHVKQELYAGGSLATANHMADFCKEVGLFAMLGKINSYEKFIRAKLKRGIQPMFFYKDGSPTVLKRRFLEDGSFRKLLEFYFINDTELNKEQTAAMIGELEAVLPKFDVVICNDFGHGMFNQESRGFLAKQAKFLSVNTQANAGNFGYHTISAYPKADYVCLDEREVRLECKQRSGDLKDIAQDIFKRIDCPYMVITRGAAGSLGYEKQSGHLVRVPSVAIKGIDAVGAGDAFFAVSSALIYNKVPLEVACFISNAVGALAISYLGNKESINKNKLVNFIKALYE